MKKVLLLLADGFEIYEASAFIDVMGWNLVDGDGTTRLYTCGIKKQLNSSFNQQILVDYTIDQVNVEDFDALAIPGGFMEYEFYRNGYNDRFVQLIQQFHSRNKWIATVCTGSLPVGKSGILDGSKATTYNQIPYYQNWLEDFGVEVVNEAVVEDNRVISCQSPASAIEVALRLLKKLTSKENASKIKTYMGFETVRL